MSTLKKEAAPAEHRAKHLGFEEHHQLAIVLGFGLVRCPVRAAQLERLRAQVPVVVVRKGAA